ncbi:MAG TPA: DUF853 domain-containing protein [Lachnospiraceae bacterium]|nr:DUF853 domain-containing protein [Lachnospiraceae bacterium]
MLLDNRIYIGRSGEEKIYIRPKMANRHGMIAGATGTGKTITLKVMAESFSDMGVPVFLADIKGDLSGICDSGSDTGDMAERIERFGLSEDGFVYRAYPAVFWDVYQEEGIPVRTTVSEMGPILLSRILGLNQTQSEILKVIFRLADDQSLLLVDMKDLKAILAYAGENAKELSLEYGNISKQSLGAIIRAVISLESEGGELFFTDPALDINDWLRQDSAGRGCINILECERLVNNPTMYSTFLLWMLSELYELMPEAGDLEKPKMVFFFDEAHLLFDSASKELLEKIGQVVKLIRSKGIGVYFITQSPGDIPDEVLSQLGNKIQHALHAYTPSEQKAAKAAAASFRSNPEFDTYDTLLNLGIGEALVSVLDEDGVPSVVKRTNILPPQSKMGPADNALKKSFITGSPLYDKYREEIDPDSAYEFLLRKASEEAAEEERARAEAQAEKERLKEEAAREKERLKAEAAAEKERLRAEAAAEKERLRAEAAAERERLRAEKAAQAEAEKAARAAEKEAEKKRKAISTAGKNVASSAAGTLGREIGNVLGSKGGKLGKKIGGNVGASLGRGIIGTLFRFK